MSVDEHTIELRSAPVVYRRAPATGAAPVYLHDLPTSSEDWLPWLERTGGIAPDLIGFGNSAKSVELDYSVTGLADFVEDLLTELDDEPRPLVGHGWGGAVALEVARRRPERITRLALIDPLPLVEDFRWPRTARAWRILGLGELMMGSTQHWMLARALRRGTVDPGAWTDERIAAIWSQFDHGTQRAILRLHRSIDADQLTEPVALDAPALLVWGEQDPWFPVRHADAYAGLLPNLRVERIAGAGHWPWLDRPEVVEQVASFLVEER